ncbi:MAG: O-antigen ligase family protein [Bryobacterales bacterium]|nr:O-antigen ligase family protein [Bryobacteraceae bacterium]MDW8130394.1 O-antigen ligase family protein [Bryobacterales bacterium]
MTWSTEPDAVFARWLLLALAPAVLAAPLRWAVLAWLLMTNLDATGSGVASHAGVGWLNALKAVVLPAWLLVRLRRVPGSLHRNWASHCWLALAVCAAGSACWSPYPLAAVKLAVGMAAVLLALLGLERAALGRGLDEATLRRFLLGSLALALVQSLGFADGSFGYAGRGMPQRFTSFVAAQQFAALLTAMLCWLLWTPAMKETWRTVGVLVLFAALAANGSRTWTLGALVALGLHAVLARLRWPYLLRIVAAVAILASVPAIRRGVERRAAAEEPANRLTATASALLKGRDRADGMGLGTARFRMEMYRGVWGAMREGGLREWVLGRGVGSAAQVATAVFPRAYRPESLDVNRVVHNEWLRLSYELGLVGLGLFLAVIAGLARLAWEARSHPEGMALASYLPALLLGLTAENVLDGAGNVVTSGLLVLIACAARARAGGGGAVRT